MRQVIVERLGMMERIHPSAYRLFEKDIIEVFVASFNIHHREPNDAQAYEYAPLPPAEIPAEMAEVFLYQQEHHDSQHRHQNPDRPFGKYRQKYINGDRPFRTSSGFPFIQPVKSPQGQQDKEGHQHIHSHH